jgi:transposase
MPKKFPHEFKRDVVTVARRGDLAIAEVAADFDISVESVRRWMRQADIDDGIRDGLTSAEQTEMVQLRRDKRRLEMENEILRRAAALESPQRAPLRDRHLDRTHLQPTSSPVDPRQAHAGRVRTRLRQRDRHGSMISHNHRQPNSGQPLSSSGRSS